MRTDAFLPEHANVQHPPALTASSCSFVIQEVEEASADRSRSADDEGSSHTGSKSQSQTIVHDGHEVEQSETLADIWTSSTATGDIAVLGGSAGIAYTGSWAVVDDEHDSVLGEDDILTSIDAPRPLPQQVDLSMNGVIHHHTTGNPIGQESHDYHSNTNNERIALGSSSLSIGSSHFGLVSGNSLPEIGAVRSNGCTVAPGRQTVGLDSADPTLEHRSFTTGRTTAMSDSNNAVEPSVDMVTVAGDGVHHQPPLKPFDSFQDSPDAENATVGQIPELNYDQNAPRLSTRNDLLRKVAAALWNRCRKVFVAIGQAIVCLVAIVYQPGARQQILGSNIG